MAESNVSAFPGVEGQAVTEVATGLDNPSTPESPVMPENGEIPSPDMTDQEAAALAPEGEAARREIGEEQLEPPAPSDIGGEHVPDPGDVVVSIEKGHKAAKAAEKEAAETPPAPEQQPGKKAVNRGRLPKADKAQKPDKEPKAEKTARPSKAAAEKRPL